MESPLHVFMLSIHAVRGLPRLRAPGIVPYIISFSLVSSCLTVSNSSLFTPAFFEWVLICFLCCPRNPQNLSQSFHLDCPRGTGTYPPAPVVDSE